MSAAPNLHVTLYSRPGCHLCEDAADLLERLAQRYAILVDEVSILGDVDLYERYKHSIPVITIAGGPTLFAPIRAAELEQALRAPIEAVKSADDNGLQKQ
jgi:glutaredoxin